MPLNSTKGNMYPWVGGTWNPLAGCKHGCVYCYLLTARFKRDAMEVVYRPQYLQDDLYKLGEGITIFVGSTGDMFGDWVDAEKIEAVLRHCWEYPKNTYLFQTKNPKRFMEDIGPPEHRFGFPPHTILGTTIENMPFLPFGFSTGSVYNRDLEAYSEISTAPPPWERARAMCELPAGYETMVSVEPIMLFHCGSFLKALRAILPNFVSVGADSKGHNLPGPSGKEVLEFISELTFTKVYQKANLKRILEKGAD